MLVAGLSVLLMIRVLFSLISQDKLKVMILPLAALAIASRSDPGPLSSQLVTWTVVPQAWTKPSR